MLAGEVGDSQIPQIAFTSPGHAGNTPYSLDEGMRIEAGTSHELRADIDRLFSRLMYDGTEVRTVVDWWLWACGDITLDKIPSFHDPRTQVTLYQEGMRVLCRMLAFPADWGSYILHEHTYAKKATAWFPTPMSLTQMMVQITMVGDSRFKSVHEPCMGTGVILMCASNHSLDLSGMDVDRDMCAWTRLHAYLYVPWLVCSGKRMIREFIERDKALQKESDEQMARAEWGSNLRSRTRAGKAKFPGR